MRMLLTLFVSMIFCFSSSAASDNSWDISTPSNMEKKVIESLIEPYASYLIVRPVGANVTSLLPPDDDMYTDVSSLPKVILTRYESSFSISFYSCAVLWDLSTLDPHLPGLQTVFGQLTPNSEEAVLSDDFDNRVAYYVFFEGDEEPTDSVHFLSTRKSRNSIPILKKNEDPRLAVQYGEQVICILDEWDGYTYGTQYLSSFASFDFDNADTSFYGHQTLNAYLDLPRGLALPKGQDYIELPFAVLEDMQVDLRGAFLSSDNFYIGANWFYIPTGDIQPQIRVGEEGEWVNDVYLDYGGWGVWKFTNYRNNSLSINIPNLELFTDYYVRLLYEDKESNYIHIYLTEYNYIIDWTAGGGDGDGGDRDDSDFPELEQKPPESNNSNSENYDNNSSHVQKPSMPILDSKEESLPEITNHIANIDTALPLPPNSPPILLQDQKQDSKVTPSEKNKKQLMKEELMEEITNISTLLSGKRLQTMLEINPEYVLFEKGGVVLELPTSFLANLALQPQDQIEIRIIKVSEHILSLGVWVNKEQLIDISGSRLQFPWDGQTNCKLVYLPDNTEITTTIQGNIVSATIHKTGGYSIEEQSDPKPIITAQTDAPVHITTDFFVFKFTILVILLVVLLLFGYSVRRRLLRDKKI